MTIKPTCFQHNFIWHFVIVGQRQSYPQRHIFAALIYSNVTSRCGQARGHCSASSDRWGKGTCCPCSHRASGWNRGQDPGFLASHTVGLRWPASPLTHVRTGIIPDSVQLITRDQCLHVYMPHFPWTLDPISFLPFHPPPWPHLLRCHKCPFLTDFPPWSGMSNPSSKLARWIAEQDKSPA